GYRAVIRFLYTKVKHEALEYNPMFTRNTDAEHLLNREFHFHAFNYRYKKTLISLSDRMRKYLKRGIDPYQAFLKVQNHMIDLADAFIDDVILHSFYRHFDKCESPTLKKGLESLVKLYALTVIDDNKAYYLEKDYMDGTKTKAINRVITKLYQNIKPNIHAFTEAFGIPEELLLAPIAKTKFS
ncbi:MAG: acyl-CoA oxidase, partial [Saprospiraceae bacterium]|nr:acyl-CoA oxidase [Saprospiraceae bacterium]